jgi:hypothetical protein
MKAQSSQSDVYKWYLPAQYVQKSAESVIPGLEGVMLFIELAEPT